MPAITLSHVTRRFGEVLAVNDLTLAIREKSFVTLLGPSGCGKTTTLRMIAGLETPTAGRIEIEGRVVFDSEKKINVPANRRGVGLLFQNYALWPNMTVYNNIAYPLEGTGLSKKEISERVQEVAGAVKIRELLDRYPAQLSGGQQQRVAIARTLAPRPRIILMDEPLSNLDAKLRLEMRAELQRLHLATGCTFLYVTHDQLEAMTLSTEICLVDQGVVKQFAPPMTMYRRPADLFAAGFVGAPPINFLPARGTSSPDGIRLTLADGRALLFRLCDKTQDAFPEDGEVILGVRPDMIRLGDSGLPGEIYSVLPAGMETTVQVRAGETLLTAVVFGGAAPVIGQPASVTFAGRDLLLFRRDTGELMGAGEIMKNEK